MIYVFVIERNFHQKKNEAKKVIYMIDVQYMKLVTTHLLSEISICLSSSHKLFL